MSEPTPSPTPHGYYKPDDNAILESMLFYYSLMVIFFYSFGLLVVCYPDLVILRVFHQQLVKTPRGDHAQPITSIDFLYTKRIDYFVDSYCDPRIPYSGSNIFIQFISQISKPVKAFIFTVWRSVRLSEKDIIYHCGLDAYLCLRLMRLCILLLSKFTIIGLIVLFPINITRTQKEECIDYCEQIENFKNNKTDDDAYSAKCLCTFVDRSSMAHIKAESHFLWVPAFAMALISLITLFDLRDEFISTIRIRREYWLSRPPQIYTIFVHRIPRKLQNAAKLRKYFDRLFPGKVLKVEMLCDLSEIQTVGDQRNRVLMALERAMAIEKKGVTPDLWLFGCGQSPSEIAPSNQSTTTPLFTRQDSPNISQTSSRSTQVTEDLPKGCCESMLNSMGIKRVSAVAFYQAELEQLNMEFANLRKKYDDEMAADTVWRNRSLDPRLANEPNIVIPYDALDETTEPTPSDASNSDRHGSSKWGPCMMAFVTFSQVTPAAIAAQSILDIDANAIDVKSAPEPRDVRWRALHDQGTRWYFLRRLMSRLIFLAILLFWGLLTSFVGAITSLDTLQKKIPDLSTFLAEHPGAASWINRGVTLIYVILLALVLPIIGFLVKLEVRIAESNVVRATGERYFVFLVMQLFLLYSIAGTVFKTLVTIIDRPSNIVSTLASTIPKNAAFYIDFITVKTFWCAYELTRSNDFICSALRNWPLGYYGTLTERERRTTICGCNHYSYPAAASLHTISANVLLIFFIATTYAVLQPWLLPAALIFMVVMYFVCCTRFNHQTRQLFDGGGTTWTHQYWAIVGAIITAQLTLIGTLLTKHGYLPALSVFFVLTAFTISALRIQDKYKGHASVIPIEIAAELDETSHSGASSHDTTYYESSGTPRQEANKSTAAVSTATTDQSQHSTRSATRNITITTSQSRSSTPNISAEEVGSELRLYNMQVYRNVVPIGKQRNIEFHSQESAIVDLESSQEKIEELEQERYMISEALHVPRVYQYLDPVLTEDDNVHPIVSPVGNIGHVFNTNDINTNQ